MQITYSIIGIAIGAFVAYILLSKKKSSLGDQSTSLTLLLQQMSELQKTVDHKLGENEKSMRESLQFQSTQSNKIISDITERLTRLDEGNKQVLGFTESLAQLQDILKNPKQRGILGEYYLETLLKNILPPGGYAMQYGFADGTIVDAVVFVKDKIIPVDSKFSLENYNRMIEEKEPARKKDLMKAFENDLKNRIVETSKYIQPENNTMDFAFMFIPHEAIYYDLLVGTVGAGEEAENLIQRAASKYKVIIVSPTSFLAYLQTVLQGLKALKIEETAKDIRRRVEELGKHLKAYEEYHNKLGTSLQTVANHYNNSGKELKKVDKDVMRISGESAGIEPILIEGAIEKAID
ncbi:MAG TPA: DNA recombination protein RmuC [Candidatus Paceibacterota bacterium]|nr:DNA recombination protein RmuC [Candidatus Paceibacterota bacterium]